MKFKSDTVCYMNICFGGGERKKLTGFVNIFATKKQLEQQQQKQLHQIRQFSFNSFSNVLIYNNNYSFCNICNCGRILYGQQIHTHTYIHACTMLCSICTYAAASKSIRWDNFIFCGIFSYNTQPDKQTDRHKRYLNWVLRWECVSIFLRVFHCLVTKIENYFLPNSHPYPHFEEYVASAAVSTFVTTF